MKVGIKGLLALVGLWCGSAQAANPASCNINDHTFPPYPGFNWCWDSEDQKNRCEAQWRAEGRTVIAHAERHPEARCQASVPADAYTPPANVPVRVVEAPTISVGNPPAASTTASADIAPLTIEVGFRRFNTQNRLVNQRDERLAVAAFYQFSRWGRLIIDGELLETSRTNLNDGSTVRTSQASDLFIGPGVTYRPAEAVLTVLELGYIARADGTRDGRAGRASAGRAALALRYLPLPWLGFDISHAAFTGNDYPARSRLRFLVGDLAGYRLILEGERIEGNNRSGGIHLAREFR